MKKYFVILAVIFLNASCSVFNSLTSTTSIKPNDSFILGKNEHGTFKAKVTNLSKQILEVYHAPLDGGKHSAAFLKPDEVVTIKVARNTGLVIQNKSDDTVNVGLRVTGDLGLSMNYQN